MIIMYIAWVLTKNISPPIPVTPGNPHSESADESTPLIPTDSGGCVIGHTNKFDIVDIHSVDLHADEYVEDVSDELDDQEIKTNLEGRFGWVWRLYYLIA